MVSTLEEVSREPFIVSKRQPGKINLQRRGTNYVSEGELIEEFRFAFWPPPAHRAVTVPPDGKRLNSRLIFELQGREANQRQVIKKYSISELMSEGNGLRRCKECFEELMNKRHKRERRADGGQLVNQRVKRISKEEVRTDVKSGKGVGDIPV